MSTPTLRSGILLALKTLIEAANVGAVVYRSREAALARAEGPAICIRPEDEPVVKQTQNLAIRDLTVCISVIARGQVPDEIADPIIAAMHAAICADQTVGGRVARIIENGTKWDFEQADQNACIAEVRYTLRYMTNVATLSALA